MTDFDLYKYHTQNNAYVVKLKQQVDRIVAEKGLSSVMNDTKWLAFQKGINNLPFPPAYNAKLIHLAKEECSFDNFEKEPSYLGNWSNYWDEGLPIFFAIEWLEIRPLYRKYKGRLVAPKILDETTELIKLLNDLSIPFEQIDRSIFTYGYK